MTPRVEYQLSLSILYTYFMTDKCKFLDFKSLVSSLIKISVRKLI